MKVAAAIAFASLFFKAFARSDEDDFSSPRLGTTHDATSSSTKKHRRPLLSPAASQGDGKVLAMGEFGQIDVSSVTAAQAGAMGILETHGISEPNIEYEPVNDDANHVRLVQKIYGMTVEGAAIMVHSDAAGNVVAINGELVDDSAIPSPEPTIDNTTAIAVALNESRVPAEFHDQCSEPTITVVRGLDDGLAYLAWTCTVSYDANGIFCKDKIFAHAIGKPGLIQIHPLIRNALSLRTRDCKDIEVDEDDLKDGNVFVCGLVSNSKKDIKTNDTAINSAHNNARIVYEYYKVNHGRDSIDGKGMTIVSLVHYDKNYDNAEYLDDGIVAYGDGDGNVTDSWTSLDIVAHELTHGVTDYSSQLTYQDEPGALSEALSDIFAALVEQRAGYRTREIWLIGEAIYKIPGNFERSMCDPFVGRRSQPDYYPERKVRSKDEPLNLTTNDLGWVHYNSGIANLAACLMVKGGTHPRQKTSVKVTPLGGGKAYSQAAYDALGKAFYFANTKCLTPGSDFAAIKICTAYIHKPDRVADSAYIAAAWEAVGVNYALPNITSPAPSTKRPTGKSKHPTRKTKRPSRKAGKHPIG